MSTGSKKISLKPVVKPKTSELVQEVTQQQPQQPQHNSDSQQPAKQETVQEVLSRLEREFNSKLEILNELREEHNKIRDKIVLAHDDMFRAYQKLAVTKENLLVNTINVQQKELSKYTPSPREDNVFPAIEEESS